jgi:hypothetical protein
MKKLIVICLVLASTNGFSQGIFKRLSFGIKAGANYSDYSNAGFATEGLVGFHAGALVNFKITDHLSVQEEFLFSSQGAKVKDGTIFGGEDIKVNYMTVPFLIKYKTKFGLYFEAGPQVGLRINEDIKNTQIGEFAKKMDLAAAGGLGYQTPFGLGFGVRYVYGLSTVGDFNYSNIKTDFRTNVAQASIFYIF